MLALNLSCPFLDMIPGVDEISTFEEVSLYYPRANIKVSIKFVVKACFIAGIYTLFQINRGQSY